MEQDCQRLLFDEESWEVLLEPVVGHDSAMADLLAHLLFSLKEAIGSGPEGCIQAIDTLQYGIERVYSFTDAHKVAFELYALYLTGNLKPCDEPHQLIKGALERFKQPTRARKSTIDRATRRH